MSSPHEPPELSPADHGKELRYAVYRRDEVVGHDGQWRFRRRTGCTL